MRVQEKTSIPFVIAGTKSDLEDERQISADSGAQLAKSLNAEFLETSAKSGKNVKEVFYALARQIRSQRGETPKLKKRRCVIL